MKVKLFLVILISSILSLGIFGAPGALDTTFGGSGYVVTSVEQATTNSPYSQLLIQPNGKILLATNSGSVSAPNITILRLNADSTPDTSFGTNGITTLSPFGNFVNVNAMALQPDGKILVTTGGAGGCTTLRVNADGIPDLSFGGTGAVSTSLGAGTGCSPSVVKVQPDGKIVVAGRGFIPQGFGIFAWIVIRYNADGSPDTGFGSGGISDSGYDPLKFQKIVNLFIQPDGKLLVCGSYGLPQSFAVARFNANGGLDTSFGNAAGIGSISSGNTTVMDAALQPDGKIVFVGGVGNQRQFLMARLNAEGAHDTAFGSNGFVFFLNPPMSAFGGNAVTVQADGKILVGGGVLVNEKTDFAVVRFGPNGSMDSAKLAPRKKSDEGRLKVKMGGFDLVQKESVLESNLWGSGGISTAGTVSGYEGITAIAVDAAGRTVVAGTSMFPVFINVYDVKQAVARFLGDGSPYAQIYGTVRSAGGLPIRNAMVTLSGGTLTQPVTVYTNNLGLYQFTGLPVTESYNVLVSAKRFRFANDQQTFILNQDRGNLDFTANP